MDILSSFPPDLLLLAVPSSVFLSPLHVSVALRWPQLCKAALRLLCKFHSAEKMFRGIVPEPFCINTS